MLICLSVESVAAGRVFVMALLVPPHDPLSLFQQNYLKAIRLFPGPLKRMDLGRWVRDVVAKELGTSCFMSIQGVTASASALGPLRGYLKHLFCSDTLLKALTTVFPALFLLRGCQGGCYRQHLV